MYFFLYLFYFSIKIFYKISEIINFELREFFYKVFINLIREMAKSRYDYSLFDFEIIFFIAR